MRRPAAFTLLELLLVLTVLGALSAVAAARFSGLRRGQGLEQAARAVQEQALRAQRLAAKHGAIVRLRLDAGARTATVERMAGAMAADPGDGQPAAMSLFDGAEDFSLSFQRLDGAATPSGPVAIIFLPDGLCDGAGLATFACAARTTGVRIAAGPLPPAIEPPP